MKHLHTPDIAGITSLSALELNKIHFANKHTRLSPRRLEQADVPSTPAAGESAEIH